MQYRALGTTGMRVSAVSFGAWALGGDFGTVADEVSRSALERAVELGVNFFDTADVYGDGRSEKLLGELNAARRSVEASPVFIATKAGRRLNPHVASGYTLQNLRAFVERSLTNLRAEAVDLLQLHCPPTDVYYMPETFAALDTLVTEGKLRHYGVSVERVEEAMKAIEFPGVATVQIIYNIFRQRPAETFLSKAQKRGVGVIARLPLSSGMLAGKMTRGTQFEPADHRNYNRHGEAFDRGETFSGLDYELSLQLVEQIRSLVPEGVSMAQFALSWILSHPAISCVIPGAKNPAQVAENAAAADLPPPSAEAMAALSDLYEQHVKPSVHQLW